MQAEVNQQPLVISYLGSYFLSELQSAMCFAPKSSFLPTLPPPLELETAFTSPSLESISWEEGL